VAVYNDTISVNKSGIFELLPSNSTYPGRPEFGNCGEVPLYAASMDGDDFPNRIWVEYLNNNSLSPLPASTSSLSLLEQTDAWQTTSCTIQSATHSQYVTFSICIMRQDTKMLSPMELNYTETAFSAYGVPYQVFYTLLLGSIWSPLPNLSLSGPSLDRNSTTAVRDTQISLTDLVTLIEVEGS
jgi:hypothetical protein